MFVGKVRTIMGSWNISVPFLESSLSISEGNEFLTSVNVK